MTEIKSEADVKREVKKLLNKYDWFYWMPAGSAYGNNNVDFNCLKNGFFLAIETKFGNIVLEPYETNDKITDANNIMEKIKTIPEVQGIAI